MRARSMREGCTLPVIGLPSKWMLPEVGACRPTMDSASVDLPQPDSPTIDRHSPLFSVRLTLLTARTSLRERLKTPPCTGK